MKENVGLYHQEISKIISKGWASKGWIIKLLKMENF